MPDQNPNDLEAPYGRDNAVDFHARTYDGNGETIIAHHGTDDGGDLTAGYYMPGDNNQLPFT